MPNESIYSWQTVNLHFLHQKASIFVKKVFTFSEQSSLFWTTSGKFRWKNCSSTRNLASASGIRRRRVKYAPFLVKTRFIEAIGGRARYSTAQRGIFRTLKRIEKRKQASADLQDIFRNANFLVNVRSTIVIFGRKVTERGAFQCGHPTEVSFISNPSFYKSRRFSCGLCTFRIFFRSVNILRCCIEFLNFVDHPKWSYEVFSFFSYLNSGWALAVCSKRFLMMTLECNSAKVSFCVRACPLVRKHLRLRWVLLNLNPNRL